jgi:hypothetical protein
VTHFYTVQACNLATLKSLLYGALGTVINTHPILSAIALDEGLPSAYWVRLPTIDLSNIVSVHAVTKDQDLELILEFEHSKRFTPPGQPFWRLNLLLSSSDERAEIDSFSLMFVYHHALGDGLSGLAFHRSLHTALSSASPGPSILTSPTTPLLQTIETLHKFSISHWVLLTTLWQAFFPPRPPGGQWTGAPITPDPKSRVRLLSLPTEAMAGLTARCKKENTSVTAALVHIIGDSFLSALPEASELLFQTPIAARRWLPESYAHAMGVWVTGDIYPYIHQRGDNIWASARATKERLIETVKTGGRDTGTGLLPWVRDYAEHFSGQVGKHRSVSIEVSNLGMAEGEGRVVFSQSASVTGAAVQVSVAATKMGGMVIAFDWQEGVVEEGVIEEAVKGVEERVKAAAEGREK